MQEVDQEHGQVTDTASPEKHPSSPTQQVLSVGALATSWKRDVTVPGWEAHMILSQR